MWTYIIDEKESYVFNTHTEVISYAKEFHYGKIYFEELIYDEYGNVLEIKGYPGMFVRLYKSNAKWEVLINSELIATVNSLEESKKVLIDHLYKNRENMTDVMEMMIGARVLIRPKIGIY